MNDTETRRLVEITPEEADYLLWQMPVDHRYVDGPSDASSYGSPRVNRRDLALRLENISGKG